MKLVYQNWSKDEVNNETVKNDIRLLSKGKLQISDDQDIDSLARANRIKKPQENNNNRKGGGGGKFRHGSGGGGGQNRNKNFKKKKY